MIGKFYSQAYCVDSGLVSFTTFPATAFRIRPDAYPAPRLNIDLPGHSGHVAISMLDTYELPAILRELADVLDAEWMSHIENCHAQAINEDAIRSQVQIIKECRAIA